jgi:hypothetical protein
VRATGIDPAEVEDIVFGCVDTIGPQSSDIARTTWLAAGLPESVPGRDRRPPVRRLATGRPLRHPGGRQRLRRPRRRGRSADPVLMLTAPITATTHALRGTERS